MEPLSEAEVDRALKTALDFCAGQPALPAQFLLEDLCGLDHYRRIAACPDAESLAAYTEDRLAFEQAMRVGAHASRCPLCAAEVADLRAIVQPQAAEVLASMSSLATPFVGRDDFCADLGAALAMGEARLLTLAAPSGMGKTRLALETAVEQAALFSAGVWYVGLGGCEGAEEAAQQIARVLQLKLSLRTGVRDQLIAHFSDRAALLILDDLRRASPAAAMVAELVAACSGLVCLATSVAALGLPGEQVYVVPPLDLPDSGRNAGGPEMGESLQLFVERVRVSYPEYLPAGPEMHSIAAICRLSGGLPLGIELAAARVGPGAASAVALELETRSLLGASTDPLHEFVAWSFDLLTPREQRLLARCSVFVEGFYAEQASAVCEEDEAAELLAALQNSAMVQCVEAMGRPRYRLLESVRNHAAQRLGADREHFERRHATFFLGYARERAEWLENTRFREAVEEVALDLPNLRAGMDRGEARGDWRMTADYEAALWLFLYLSGMWPEALSRAQRAVKSCGIGGDEAGRDRAQIHYASLLGQRGDLVQAETLLSEIAARAAQRRDTATQVAVAYRRGHIAQLRGRSAEAAAHFEEVRRHSETGGALRETGDTLTHLGKIEWDRGELEAAEMLLREALSIHRQCPSRYSLSSTLSVLANILLEQGRIEEAEPLFHECMQMRRELADARGQAATLCNLGQLALAQQDFMRAEYCLTEAARRFETLGARAELGAVRCYEGRLALEQGRLRLARARFETAVQILAPLDRALDLAECEGGLARLDHLEGDRRAARRLYLQALERLHAGDAARKFPQLLHWFGQFLAEEGAWESAALACHAALACYAPPRAVHRDAVSADLKRIEANLAAASAALRREMAASQSPQQLVGRLIQEQNEAQ